jgi:hypothetical protein
MYLLYPSWSNVKRGNLSGQKIWRVLTRTSRLRPKKDRIHEGHEEHERFWFSGNFRSGHNM